MFRRLSARALSLPAALAVTAFVVGDWLVVSSISDAEDAPQVEEPVVDAFMSGQDGEVQVLDGVQVSIVADAEGAFHTTLSNTDEVARAYAFDVYCYERTGSPFSRVSPPPDLASTTHLEGELLAGQTIEKPLGCSLPEKKDVSAEEAEMLADMGMDWIHYFRIQGPGAEQIQDVVAVNEPVEMDLVIDLETLDALATVE